MSINSVTTMASKSISGAFTAWTFLSLGVSALLCASFPAPCQGGEPAVLTYRFTAGQTNVYAVEASLEAEEGKIAYDGNIVMVVADSREGQAALVWRGHLGFKLEGQRALTPGVGGFRPRINRPIAFAPGAELGVDTRGRVLSVFNDAMLPLQAGGLGVSLVIPLPANQGEALAISAETSVPDDSPRRGVRPMMDGYYDPSMGMMGRSGPTLVATKQTRIALEPVEGTRAVLVRETEIRSLAEVGGSPRFLGRAKTKGAFDLSLGLMREVSLEYTETAVAKTVSRRSEFTLRARLLEGEELVAALKAVRGPAEASTKKLNAEEVKSALADLKSEGRREEAQSRLVSAGFDALPADMGDLAVEMLAERESPYRHIAAKVLAAAAASQHVPFLVKQLGDNDWSVRTEVMEALGRLKDKRAIGPLAEMIARGEGDRQKAVEVLCKFGSAAEDAALGLLKENNLETRRDACRILGQVGTRRGLKPLQEAMTDRDDMLRQAASEAVGAIQRRKE